MSAVLSYHPALRPYGRVNPPLASSLGQHEAEMALSLFRSGLDNVQIASRMGCTPAAAANGIARARDEERRAVA